MRTGQHVLGSGLGLMLTVVGTFALAAHLARSRAGDMVLSVHGAALFLFLLGVASFSAPDEGQAYLAGIEGLSERAASFADTVFGFPFLAVIGLSLIGNELVGVAVWRSGLLPRWAGALPALGRVAMYVLELVYAGAVCIQCTPPTVPLGAQMRVASGLCMAGRVLRGSSGSMAQSETV